ncbi:DUF6973 domain-containing protein [Mycobacteriaceae bacterium NPDC060252]
MPSYEPGRGYPGLDQNNGVSIYNSAAPQPSQAAQPSRAPVQNPDGSYNRAANGEQQPINYNNAPNNQQLDSDWQQRSDQLNNPQQSGQNDTKQEDQPQNRQRDKDRTCDAVTAEYKERLFEELDALLAKGGVAAVEEFQGRLSSELLASSGLSPSDCLGPDTNISHSGQTNAACSISDPIACIDKRWDSLSQEEKSVCKGYGYRWDLVIDCIDSVKDWSEATELSAKYFPNSQIDGKGDAARHCIWQALTALDGSPSFAEQMGNAHEQGHPGTADAEAMDQSNNRVGRAIRSNTNDRAEAISECVDWARRARKVEHPASGYWPPLQPGESLLIYMKDE